LARFLHSPGCRGDWDRGRYGAALMREAYVIELPTGAAGVAIRIRGGFLFYASDDRFRRVDKRAFSNLRALHASLTAVAPRADRPPGIPAHAESAASRS
jgi:hypothetical protein